MAQFILVTPIRLQKALGIRLQELMAKYNSDMDEYIRRWESGQRWSELHRTDLEKAYKAMLKDYNKKSGLVRLFVPMPHWNDDGKSFSFFHSPRIGLVKAITGKTELIYSGLQGKVSLPEAPFLIEKPMLVPTLWSRASDRASYLETEVVLSLEAAETYGVKYTPEEIRSVNELPAIAPQFY